MTPILPAKSVFEQFELAVEDLCLFTGDPKYSSLQSRVIYQVVDKRPINGGVYSNHTYILRRVFDLENPSGSTLTTETTQGTRGLKKLDVVDLGMIRSYFDRFLQSYAKSITTLA